MAKICQFSSLADYENIIDKADTNKSIIEAEKKGECKLLQEPPNKFEIQNSGYYWYVVSTLLSDDENVRTTYNYSLTKLSYNRTSFGTPHECSVSESRSGCVVADAVFLQTSTKNMLASLTGSHSSGPFTVIATRQYAVGVAIVPLAILEIPTIIVFIVLCTYCLYNIKKKYCN